MFLLNISASYQKYFCLFVAILERYGYEEFSELAHRCNEIFDSLAAVDNHNSTGGDY